MKKMIRKAMLFGMGVASLTREKIENFVKDLEKEGKITEKEGRQLVEDMIKEAEKRQKEISKSIKKQVQGIANKSPLATKDDIRSLEKKMTKKKPATKPKKKKK